MGGISHTFFISYFNVGDISAKSTATHERPPFSCSTTNDPLSKYVTIPITLLPDTRGRLIYFNIQLYKSIHVNILLYKSLHSRLQGPETALHAKELATFIHLVSMWKSSHPINKPDHLPRHLLPTNEKIACHTANEKIDFCKSFYKHKYIT